MYGQRLIALTVIVSSIYGQSLAPRQDPWPQRLYAVYSDASVSNISLVSSREETLLPSNSDITIPLSCHDPLQCSIPPQQNGFSVFYIPNEEHSSLIQLKLEGQMLYTHNIAIPCVFNDFVLQPNVRDFPLMIACELTAESNNNIRYILSNPYGNVTRDRIESVPTIHQAVVSPILLKIRNADAVEGEDGDNIFVVSVDTQNQIVIYGVQTFELDRYPLELDQPCVPVRIQKIQSDIAFLLTCQDSRSYLVNTSAGISNINLVSIPNPVMAIANSIRYSLTVINSTATVTIREVLSQPAAVRTIQLNATTIYGAGFGPDDKFAYVATDREIIFIDVLMGLEGIEQFTHMTPIPVCSQCPSVVFLNNTSALVSSSDTLNNAIIHFFDLSSWPPLNSMNRTLSKQPKVYWYNNQYIQPTPTITQTTSFVSSSNSLNVSPSLHATGDGDSSHNRNTSNGSIAVLIVVLIVVLCTCTVFLSVVMIAFIDVKYRKDDGETIRSPRIERDEMDEMVTGMELLELNMEPATRAKQVQKQVREPDTRQMFQYRGARLHKKTKKDSLAIDKTSILAHVIPVDGPYQINCDGHSGGYFVWEDCGLEINFPPECSQQHIQVTTSTFLPVKNEVHPGVHIVSAVYQFNCNIQRFDKAFTLRLQHCIKLQSPEDCQKMCFIIQHDDNNDVKYGHFEVEDSYGTVNLHRFCNVFIEWICKLGINILTIILPITDDQDNSSQGASSNQETSASSGAHSEDLSAIQTDHIIPSQSASGQQHDCLVPSCSSATFYDMKREHRESKPADSPVYKYESMIGLPRDRRHMREWSGIYSIYVKLGEWRKVSKESMQMEDVITNFPVNFYADEIEFDVGGVAMITYKETSIIVRCQPNQIKKEDVNNTYEDYVDTSKKYPFWNRYNNILRTIIQKSFIYVTKISDAPPSHCQLTINGIKPHQQVDLCTSCTNLTLVDTVDSCAKVNAGPVRSVSRLLPSVAHSPDPSYYNKAPEMWDLIKLVIPKIKAEWKHVAYSMQYGIDDINGIEKDSSNLAERCQKLFENWLASPKGITPKTWHTLLQCIRDVDNLTVAAENINTELKDKYNS